MVTLGAVFVGGGLGAVLRYLCGVAEPRVFRDSDFPSNGRGTLAANVIASLIAGMCFAYFADHGSPLAQALLVSGICGGLSTYSTLSLELVQLVRDRRIKRAGWLLILNVGVGMTAVLLGSSLVAAFG